VRSQSAPAHSPQQQAWRRRLTEQIPSVVVWGATIRPQRSARVRHKTWVVGVDARR
jgi:hypothetical protein